MKNNQTLDLKKKKNQTRHTLIGKVYNKIQKKWNKMICVRLLHANFCRKHT